MNLDLFHVDAFARHVFSGNPAAICPLTTWLADARMQEIAAENNLSETAFFVPQADGAYGLRWFTPTTEVDLCGHATLASAHVIWQFLGGSGVLEFHTRSGRLSVERAGELIMLDFPSIPLVAPEKTPAAVGLGLGGDPEDVLTTGETNGSGFWMAVFKDQTVVQSLVPDIHVLSGLGKVAVVATAPGKDCDFASRCFAPGLGIPEDPVTGSIHCFLTPYWASKLGKPSLYARQVSDRGGELFCENRGSRVRIGGYAVCYSAGKIDVPSD